MLSLHVATTSVRVRRWDCKGRYQLQDEDLCDLNLLFAGKLFDTSKLNITPVLGTETSKK